MAQRFRRSVRRGRRNGKNLTWITVVVKASLLENTPTQIAQLVIPSDWSLVTGFDRATLVRIRGWLSIGQVTVGTSADATAAYAAIALQDGSSADVMNPSVASDYDDYDVLWTGGCGVTAGAAAGSYYAANIDIKAKRRLTTQEEVSLFTFLDIDTAAPRVNYNGVLRALVQTD